MAERSNAAVLKTVIPRDGNRGFESHSLLHISTKRLQYHTLEQDLTPIYYRFIIIKINSFLKKSQLK